MSSNYFDDMGSAIEEEEIDEEDFDGELDDDDEVDDDGLNDGVTHRKSSSYDNLSDIEEYQGPSHNEKSRNMDVPVSQFSSFREDDYEELSLSDRNRKKTPKKKSKFFIIFLVITITISAIALLGAYSIYQRDKAPSIREVHIESDNPDDPTVAEYGNMITLTFTFNEDLDSLPIVIIMGRQVEVFGEGKTYFAKYFVQDQDNDDQLVTFTIKDYKDSFSKVGAPITTTTDSSKVIILGYHFS